MIPVDAADKARGARSGARKARESAAATTRASASRIAAPRSTSTIPDAFRVGHEAHFAQVTARFLSYLRDRKCASRVGTAEHAGEVFRDDDGHRVESSEPAAAGAAHRAAVVAHVPGRMAVPCDDGRIENASAALTRISRPRKFSITSWCCR